MVLIQARNNSSSILKYVIFIFIICLILVGNQFLPHASLPTSMDYNNDNFSSKMFSLNKSRVTTNAATSSRTLIVYVYAKTHQLAEQNLAFFIRATIRDSHDADYYFILQEIDNKTIDEKNLPLLPSNAHYIHHENKCFDIGTIGWFLSSGMIDKSKYKYFIFLNSSVRGPFIVSYYDNPIWYTIFTRRLNDQIKLVGSTINCEIAPHVQSYIWALDFEGLNFLLKNSTVFKCHESKDATITTAEVGASQIILKSGFGIDSLMTKYQGVDFRFNGTKKCTAGLNPTFNGAADGITLDPFEVVFVKMKNDMAQGKDNPERVRVYEQWMHG
jgi:hypothetical protein